MLLLLLTQCYHLFLLTHLLQQNNCQKRLLVGLLLELQLLTFQFDLRDCCGFLSRLLFWVQFLLELLLLCRIDNNQAVLNKRYLVQETCRCRNLIMQCVLKLHLDWFFYYRKLKLPFLYLRSNLLWLSF